MISKPIDQGWERPAQPQQCASTLSTQLVLLEQQADDK